jgi:hypothetical protein
LADALYVSASAAARGVDPLSVTPPSQSGAESSQQKPSSSANTGLGSQFRPHGDVVVSASLIPADVLTALPASIKPHAEATFIVTGSITLHNADIKDAARQGGLYLGWLDWQNDLANQNLCLSFKQYPHLSPVAACIGSIPPFPELSCLVVSGTKMKFVAANWPADLARQIISGSSDLQIWSQANRLRCIVWPETPWDVQKVADAADALESVARVRFKCESWLKEQHERVRDAFRVATAAK